MARGWGKEQLNEYERRRNKAGALGPSATNPKPVEGLPLERVHKGKEKGGNSTIESDQSGRYKLQFTFYAVRPADCDAYHIKELVDGIVKARLMDDDNWRILESITTSSKKVHKKSEEKTVVEIIPLNP